VTGLLLPLLAALAAAPGPTGATGPTGVRGTAGGSGPTGANGSGASAASRGGPARIEADEIHYSWATRKVKVIGKPWVTMRRDDLTLTCRRLDGENDDRGQLQKAVCQGDVKLVRGPRTVTCDKATYDRAAATIICEGNPVLQDGAAEARGKRLTYLLDEDEVKLEEAVQATLPSDQLEMPTKGGKVTPGGGGQR
jgi:lipopolysaccharide export system protein LptA